MKENGIDIQKHIPKIVCGVFAAAFIAAACIAGFDTAAGKGCAAAAAVFGVVLLISLVTGNGKKSAAKSGVKNGYESVSGADKGFSVSSAGSAGGRSSKLQQEHGYDISGKSGPATDLPRAVNYRSEKARIESGLVFHESHRATSLENADTYVSLHAADEENCVFSYTEFNRSGDNAVSSINKMEASVPFVVLYDNHGKAIELVNDRFNMQLTKNDVVPEREYNSWVEEKGAAQLEKGKPDAFAVFKERTEVFFKVEGKNGDASHYFAVDKKTNELYDVYANKNGFTKLPVKVTYDQFVHVAEKLYPGMGKFCRGLSPETRKSFDMTAIMKKWKLEKSTEKIIEKKTEEPSMFR